MQIIGALLSAYWWAIPFFIIALYLKTSSGKGFLGEMLVNFSATLMLDKSKYHLIKNVTLPTEDGTTQIDHIIVSQFGVFIIETKNYAGWIFGGAHQKMWTQKFYRSSRQFQNPLHQNYKHVRTLGALLGLESDVIHSLIVFVGDSTFKTPMPENVTKSGGYIRFIKSKISSVLSAKRVAEIIDQIQFGRLKPSLKTNRDHTQHVKKTVAAKKAFTPSVTIVSKIEPDGERSRCPICGGDLVLRTVKTGAKIGSTFFGCSGYPSCRYILKIQTIQPSLF
ncbi:MAG: NERD domain-containing protein [Burkholderiaceae bacterium]